MRLERGYSWDMRELRVASYSMIALATRGSVPSSSLCTLHPLPY